MIDLKRNSKKEPVKATGLRTRASSSYSPNQKEDFKISRGRFSNSSLVSIFNSISPQSGFSIESS